MTLNRYQTRERTFRPRLSLCVTAICPNFSTLSHSAYLQFRASVPFAPRKATERSSRRPSMPQLRFHVILTLALALTALGANAQQPSPAAAPSPATTTSPADAQLLKNAEAFVRNLFAWGPDFAVKLGPLAPSPSPDFYLVPLTVTIHDQADTGTVFVSKDGKTFLRGEMYDTS